MQSGPAAPCRDDWKESARTSRGVTTSVNGRATCSGHADRAHPAGPLFLTLAVDGLHVVDLGHRIPVYRNLELPLAEVLDGVDRHVEIGMLPLLSDQKR